MKHTRLVIVGGGVTGLAAAWEAQRVVGDDYLLVESEPRLGGKVVTTHRPGPGGDGAFVIDGGPESFVSRKPDLTRLVEETGLADQLIDPGAESRGMFVLTGGQALPVPMSAGSFLTTGLMTVGGKARMLAEPFIRGRADAADESLAAFVSRRLGRQASERMIGPVLGGIYHTDPARQSIAVTAPIMREMEASYGSLVRAAVARGLAKRRQPPRRYPAFVSFAGGAQGLVDGIEARLTGEIVVGTGVRRVGEVAGGMEVQLADGRNLTADAVILACPAPVAATVLDHPATQLLKRIDYNDVGTATLIYPTGTLGQLASVRGCMVPAREERRIDAVMVTSKRMPDRTVPGYEMVRVFFGANDPSLVGLPDGALLSALHTELDDLFAVPAEPLGITAFHWPGGYPQAAVGHLGLVDQIEAELPDTIAVAGSAYRGVGVPDCIRQGRTAAQRVLAKETVR